MNNPNANPLVQAIIALILLVMFAVALFLPAWFPDFHPDASVLQTLLTLVVVGVSFYLGSASGSARKDETIRDMLPTKPEDGKP